MVLASTGIYGLLAFMVGPRSREIGLRMALGARPADILKLILTKGVILAGVGIIAGVILSASTASMMSSLLYGVRPHDPAVFVVVCADPTNVRDRRGKVPLAEQHRSGRRISADAGEGGIPHLPDSVMEVDSDVE